MSEPMPETEKLRNSKRKEYSAPALEKGLDILQALAEEERGLNISDLAKRLGRSVGEVFRMVAVLEQRGYIQVREQSDAYVLTLKLFYLAHRLPPIARLSAAAVPEMSALASDTGQSCHLVIYFEGQGHVVGQQDAPSERIFSVRLGAQAPLLDTCSGHVLLAFSDEAERGKMIDKIPPHQRKPGAMEIEDLVWKVRRKGYETIKSPQVRGVHDVGFPVFDRNGRVLAALVIPFVSFLDGSHPVSLPEASRLIGAAATRISAALGYAQAP